MQTHGKISTYRSGIQCRCDLCTEANRKYQREYKRRIRPDSSKWHSHTQMMKYVREYKKNPCTDCQQTFPVECMDFDHLPKFDKKFNLASMIGYSAEAIEQELAKCELVCSNCHRIRTAARRRAGG